MGFNDELQALVDEVANRVDRWTGHTGMDLRARLAASAEVANTEVRAGWHSVGRPAGPYGLPVRADGDEAGG